jgi:hypothetical protein
MAGTPRTRARRPAAVLVAAFLALGGIGTVAGMALGAVGTASADAHHGDGRPHVGPDRGLRPGDR